MYKFKNDESINAMGTSFKGYVKTTYADLVEKFGEPTYTNGADTTAEWNLEFEVDADNGSLGEDGNIEYVTATIYDYRTYDTPMGEYNWHVGGYGMDAVYLVMEVLSKSKVDE
jgi:hypothetical protein